MPSKIALILLLLSALPAHAEEIGPTVRPGAWEVKSSTEGQPSVGYQLCFRSGSRDDIALLLPRAADAACPAPGLRRDGGDLVWELECPAVQLSGSARYRVQSELIEGRIEIRSGTPAVAQRSALSARYVGACSKD
jgi:hypothetical protein